MLIYRSRLSDLHWGPELCFCFLRHLLFRKEVGSFEMSRKSATVQSFFFFEDRMINVSFYMGELGTHEGKIKNILAEQPIISTASKDGL